MELQHTEKLITRKTRIFELVEMSTTTAFMELHFIGMKKEWQKFNMIPPDEHEDMNLQEKIHGYSSRKKETCSTDMISVSSETPFNMVVSR